MHITGIGCYEESIPDEHIEIDFKGWTETMDDVFREDIKKEILECLQGFDINVSEACWEDECDGCQRRMRWQYGPTQGYFCDTKGCWNNEETYQETLKEAEVSDGKTS